MLKSNKQKCLEMWQWLAKNPGKSKSNYYCYLNKIGKENEYSSCWACEESGFICEICPINFPQNHCENISSPYYIWDKQNNFINYIGTVKKFNPSIQIQAALAMVKLIKETWREIL